MGWVAGGGPAAWVDRSPVREQSAVSSQHTTFKWRKGLVENRLLNLTHRESVAIPSASVSLTVPQGSAGLARPSPRGSPQALPASLIGFPFIPWGFFSIPELWEWKSRAFCQECPSPLTRLMLTYSSLLT